MQVIDPNTGDFTDVARANLVVQINNQAKAALETKFTQRLGQHGKSS